jgi:hypothetical protein
MGVGTKSYQLACKTDLIGNKHRPVVIASLLWQPFDSRFEEILQRMESHRTILKEVLDLNHKRTTLEAHEKMEREWEAAKAERREAEKARTAEGDAAEKAEIERQEQREERKNAEIARLDQVVHRFNEEREREIAKKARLEAQRAREDHLETSMKEVMQAQRGMTDSLISWVRSTLICIKRCSHPSYPGLAFTARICPRLRESSELPRRRHS